MNTTAGLVRIEKKVQSLLDLKRAVEQNLHKAFDHPSLESIKTEILEKSRQLEELLIAFAKGSESERFNPLNEDRLASDDMSTALSSHERLRRRQSKELGRRLYSKFHPDRATEGSTVLTDFHGLRGLVNSGEIEVLRYLDVAVNSSVMPSNLDDMLDVRISVYQTQPAFRLVRSYLSGSNSHLKDAMSILQNKKRLLDQRIGDLLTTSSRSTNEQERK